MSTLSIPLTPHLEELVNDFVQKGFAPNKAEVMRKALRLLAEEEAIKEIKQAEQDLKAGRIYRGDLNTILKNFRAND